VLEPNCREHCKAKKFGLYPVECRALKVINSRQRAYIVKAAFLSNLTYNKILTMTL
jgi:hypothetical protein